MNEKLRRVCGRLASSLLYIAAFTLISLEAPPVTGLSSNELILHPNTAYGTTCSQLGVNVLYLTADAWNLSSWGWNDVASGYKRGSTAVRLYEHANMAGEHLQTGTLDCDLYGDGWNDRASSVDFYPYVNP
ncbi:MAG TPA: hypothetical protein VNO86_07740 [Candidatus Binatia bacterium]|nr:hypothetical protein [Candidatus Binatia bacterium]